MIGWFARVLRLVPIVREFVPVVRDVAEAVKPPPTVAESNAKGEAAAKRQADAFEALKRGGK